MKARSEYGYSCAIAPVDASGMKIEKITRRLTATIRFIVPSFELGYRKTVIKTFMNRSFSFMRISQVE